MKLFRSIRFHGALVALLSLFFMQLALAGYACPVESVGPSPAMAAMMASGVDMAHCEQMSVPMVPNLCHATVHAKHQSLDKPELPVVPMFIAGAVAMLAPPADPALRVPQRAAGTMMLARANAPPLAIRHCCFRI